MLSKFHIFSLGTVTKDKEDDSDIVYAIPYEALTDLDGELSTYTESVNGNLKDIAGKKQFSSAEKAATLRCEWLPFGDMRTTSPDMILGEQVIIWRYADTEDYYWTPKRQDLLNRKLEHIVFTLSNTKDDQEESEPYKKAYTITLSTRDQYLSIVTDDNQKEKAKYEIKLNTQEGIFSLTDNHRNEIRLNSPDRKFTLVTGDVLFDCSSFTNTGTFTNFKWTLLKDTLEVIKSSTLKDTLTVSKATSLKATLSVSSTGSIGGSLSVGGAVSASGYSGGPGVWHKHP